MPTALEMQLSELNPILRMDMMPMCTLCWIGLKYIHAVSFRGKISREALPLEGGMGICHGHGPLLSGQLALPSLIVYHHCAAHVPPPPSF